MELYSRVLECDANLNKLDARSITSDDTVDWRIPRPVLYTSSSSGGPESAAFTSNYENNIKTIYGLENNLNDKLDNVEISIPIHGQGNWFSLGSSSSSSSRTASSGSLLLSPSNLHSLKYGPMLEKPLDAQSIASSTHFTLVNGVTLPKKPLSPCCTKSRQLPVLIITMTTILFCGILAAILLVEMRAMELRGP
ncbi:hypothetical protein RUM43_010822 [Polyplax serrata]|uniref:Uncharacterized protein n=1 Tax=Polyplax serrata TaxID=468196 RepID=A0AAN8NKZ5_POLSC